MADGNEQARKPSESEKEREKEREKSQSFSAFNIVRTRNHFSEVLENLCQKIKKEVPNEPLLK